MKRKITQALEAWKQQPQRKPLVLQGARQVGKTYSVLAFARSAFKNTVHIDFSAQPEYAQIFSGDLTPAIVLPQIEALAHTNIDPEQTLLFFDEIQACPRALTALKYFQERAPRYALIAAGSLLGVSLGREEYSFPVGKVDSLRMYPLDFEEFLWALGEEKMCELIRTHYASHARFALHERALELYRLYLIVGGMPEVVASQAAGASALDIQVLQRNLIDGYVADMTKYANPLESSKILNVWRSIPEQLAKENHKFQYTTIVSSARAHQYEAPINWLSAAGLVSFCYRVREGSAPLDAYVEHDFFKLYLLDTGLLCAMQGVERPDVNPQEDKGSYFRGGIAENYVAQQLQASGASLYYWGTTSKSEVDFVLSLPGTGIVPLEVKSGGNVSARSLEAYRKAYAPSVVYRLSTKNFGQAEGVCNVPVYAAFCIEPLRELLCLNADSKPKSRKARK